MANAKVWSERVAEWRASGESAEVYASGRGYAGSTLLWWSSRLARGVGKPAKKPEGTREVRLARVVRAPEPASSAASVIVEVHGARVLVPTGVDAATLKTVLAALGGAS